MSNPAIIEQFGAWLAAINPADHDYDHLGVRVIPNEDKPEIGATVPNSWDWYEAEYGSGDRIELDGACAITIDRAARLTGQYFGRWVVLIGGNRASTGDDHGEIIISNPTVLAIFDRGTMTCVF